MSPTPTLALRRYSAAFALAWALLAMFLSLIGLRTPDERLSFPFLDARLGDLGVVEVVSPAAAAAGLEVGDFVHAVDGRALVRDADKVKRLRRDVANSYSIEKPSGERLALSLLPEPASWALTPGRLLLHAEMLVSALIYLVIGGGVWWIKRDRPAAWAFLLFSCAMSVQLSVTMNTDYTPFGWRIFSANVPLLGATTFHLFTTYPIEPSWIVRNRRIQVVPYLFAAGLGLLCLFEERLGLPVGLANQISLLGILAMISLSLAIASAERQRHPAGAIRERATLLVASALISFVPVLVGLALEWFLRLPFPYYALMLTTAIFPIAIAYGIVRRQLFGIRSLAKSSAAYGATTLAITGLFAFVITFADTLVWRAGVSLRWLQVVFLFVAILAFNPLRNRAQALVDRFFDRDFTNYRTAVREISEAMVSMLSLDEIADRILIALTETMGVERAMVFLVDDDRKALLPLAWRGDWEDEDTRFEIASSHPIWRQLWMRRENIARPDFDEEADVDLREACWDVFDSLEVELLVPILYGVDLLGCIAVGRKLSGDRLVAEDRTLLRTLANQSSIAIENAQAFDQIAKLNQTLEARVEERTQELREAQAQLVQSEKMKSLGQLVAGVAHELNNPIGFVHANLQLLDEYMKKLIAAQKSGADTRDSEEVIGKLLARSREGTERVKKIVQDLRTFSRMDQAQRQDADLNEEIERTLALMEPRFKNGIRVERDFGKLPRVRCYPGQLNQVFLNLLMNSCDALDAAKHKGTIRIRTRPEPGGVRLEFQDDGPGIPPAVQNRIFDPFFTTKAVGVGTGLGLSISHGILERHGGRISYHDAPKGGACFVLELPLEAPLEQAPSGVAAASAEKPPRAESVRA
jgi:signal transduction histidine kinase